jgi:large subunit ribosomal protein L10
MKSKGKKEQELDALKKDLADVANVFVAQFMGITVAQDTDLRQKIRGVNGKYKVVKNTLARAAAKGTPAEALAAAFKGSTAVAFNAADPVALAKVLTAYAKINPVFVFKAGMVEGRVVNLADLDSIASLPSKEELIAKVLFLVNAPAQRLAVAAGGVARNLAVVVQQAVEQNKFQI